MNKTKFKKECKESGALVFNESMSSLCDIEHAGDLVFICESDAKIFIDRCKFKSLCVIRFDKNENIEMIQGIYGSEDYEGIAAISRKFSPDTFDSDINIEFRKEVYGLKDNDYVSVTNCEFGFSSDCYC